MEGDFSKPTKVVGPYAVLETKATDRLARPTSPEKLCLEAWEYFSQDGLDLFNMLFV